MGKLIRRLGYWLHQRSREEELAEEIESHRALAQQELEQQGAPGPQSQFEAHKRLGNDALALEDARGVWIWPWAESVWQDVRYTLHNLRREPGYCVSVVATLSLAVGLNVSLFSLFNAATLHPWPVKDASDVVKVLSVNPGSAPRGYSLAAYRYLAREAQSFSGMVAVRNENVQLEGDPGGARSLGQSVSANFFQVLGIPMETGRGFLAEEDQLDAPAAVVVLSHDTWQRRYNSDPHILGRKVRLNGVPFSVVGVAGKSFQGVDLQMEAGSLWIPLSSIALLRPNDPFVRVFLREPASCCSVVAGRLAPGRSRAQARAELELLDRQFRSQYRIDPAGVQLTGTSMLSDPRSSQEFLPVMTLMFLGVVLVLGLACANTGNLLLARSAARRREIAVRFSLGADRRRIVRQLLTESLVLSLAAGAIGLWISYWLPQGLGNMMGLGAGAAVVSFRPDTTVLAFALAVSLLTCAGFGLAPALHATRAGLSEAMKAGGSRPAGRLSLRSLLLTVQVAASVILLSSAGLLVRSIQNTRASDPGFTTAGVWVASLDLPANSYDAARTRQLASRIVDDLRAASPSPAAYCLPAPLGEGRTVMGLGRPGGASLGMQMADLHEVSPGYFEVLGIPFVSGQAPDTAGAERGMVVINETLAKRLFPGENPVGKTMAAGKSFYTVSGVARDAHTIDLQAVMATLYLPYSGTRAPRFLMRSGGPDAGSVLKTVVSRLEPQASVRVAPLAESLDRSLKPSQYGATLAALLGLSALLLATIGMCGVFGYVVRRQSKDIAIRMALGARAGQAIGPVLWDSSRAVLAGVAAGLLGAAGSSLLLRSYLYGVSPLDPATYGSVAGILALAAAGASYWTARLAARVDPLVELRSE